jgi:hypothetical protein
MVEKLVSEAKKKKFVLSIISLIVGIALAALGDLRVLAPLGVADNEGVDVIITGLFITGGTEGFNSVMKFLGYKKEEQKVETDTKRKADPDSDATLAAG